MHRPGGCSVNSSARAPPCAVAGWPRLPRPGSHGKPERDAKLQSPVSRPTGAVLGSSRIGRDFGGDGRVRCALKASARKLGPDGRVACGTGWESNCAVRSRCARRRVARRASRSIGYGRLVGMATKPGGLASISPWCAPDGGCKRRMHAVVFPMRALRQPCPFTYASLRGRCAFLLPLGCAARPPAMACRVGVHLGGDGGRERLRGRPSRRLRRLLRGDLAGGEHGAPRPGRLALSPQASADRPAGSPRHCNRSRRRRTQKRWPSPRRARTGGRRCPRRHMVHIPPVVLPVRGRIACSRRAT